MPTPMPISPISNSTPIASDLTAAVDESKQPLPYNQTGITADQVTVNSPKPQSIAAFRSRGGITNTINEMRNNAIKEQRSQAIKTGYEKLLQGNTRAADAVYQAYSQKIKEQGGNPEDWIPPKDLFYDQQTGYFLPHKYYEAVYVGAKKFEEDKLNKDKLAREQAEKDAKIQSNEAFGQAISGNPQMTKQEGMGQALQQGTVTPEMMQAAGSLQDPTKNTAKKLDLDWAKLKRQQNSDRLRELSILLTQSQNRNEAIRKAGEKIAAANQDLREIQQRKKDLSNLYNKALRGEVVRMQIEGVDTRVTVEDLSEMVRNAEVLETDAKASIDELKSMQKTNTLSPVRTNVNAGAESLTNKYDTPESSPSPAPVTQPKPVIKPNLSISPKPMNSTVTPVPKNDPLGIR